MAALYRQIHARNLSRPKTEETLTYFHYSALRVNTRSLWIGIQMYAKPYRKSRNDGNSSIDTSHHLMNIVEIDVIKVNIFTSLPF